VGIDLPSIRDREGHTSTGSGVVGLLKMTVWKAWQYKNLEDDSTLLNMVYSEITWCLKLQRL
jgi:hypothetical protein